MHLLPAADLLVGRLEPFEGHWIEHYPTIKNPSNLPSGTSVCKLGFPFHSVEASFDEETGGFHLAPGTLPIPRFPIEGIVTREVILDIEYLKGHNIKFLETSSPGLRGQSGGPIFDTSGNIWAVQSHTNHLELGFEPAVNRGKDKVVENQFLNVGVGVHPEVIINHLTELGVKYSVSDY